MFTLRTGGFVDVVDTKNKGDPFISMAQGLLFYQTIFKGVGRWSQQLIFVSRVSLFLCKYWIFKKIGTSDVNNNNNKFNTYVVQNSLWGYDLMRFTAWIKKYPKKPQGIW